MKHPYKADCTTYRFFAGAPEANRDEQALVSHRISALKPCVC